MLMSDKKMKHPSPDLPWKNRISHHAQLGGIETSVIDNGPGRGTRIAWVNTGSGLRYKVVLDRAMDIADAFFDSSSLCWLSATGIVSPIKFLNRGTDWLQTFGGGLLTTCGLSHMGGPEKDEYGETGLHGPVSNTPAELESIVQPHISESHDMSITGRVREVSVMGINLEMKRTIRSRLGESWISISDVVTNRSNMPAPHMLLYHFNFGWPLVDEGTRLLWKGDFTCLDNERDSKIFNSGRDYLNCPAPMEAHRGKAEAGAFFDVPADDAGECVAGLHNTRLNIAVSLRFNKSQLPWLTNWQHWGPGEYVTGVEPGTNPPIGRTAAKKRNQLIMLEPGESKKYDLRIDVLNEDAGIRKALYR